MKKLNLKAAFVAVMLAGLCLASCRDNNSGAEGENLNVESNPGYEEGEMENAKGGNPSTGGDSTDVNSANDNLESGSGSRTGNNTGSGSEESGSGNAGGSPHSEN